MRIFFKGDQSVGGGGGGESLVPSIISRQQALF